MAIVKEITTSGQNNISTLTGSIRLEEGRGRLVVYDPVNGQERSVQDVNGFHVFNNGVERSRLDELGLTTIRSNGEYSNRVGQAESDNRDGIWVAKPGIDLRDQGI